MAVKRGVADKLIVASCGIGDWHVGKPADSRMRQTALERGLAINTRAKVFVESFLDDFDYILASDQEVLKFLHGFARTPEQKAKLHLMTIFSKTFDGASIPDPYYEGKAGFDRVLDLLEDACAGILDQLFFEKK